MRKRLLPLWVPILFLATMALSRAGMGEFWRWPSFDPDYVYLLSSQRVALGKLPLHVDHPGTPVQMFGAIVLRALSSTDQQIAATPEFYLMTLSWLIVTIAALLLWRFGAAVQASGTAPEAVLIAQALPLLTPGITLENLMRFDPEPFILSAGLALSWLIARDEGKPGWLAPAAAGCIAGLGVALKLNFLPVAIALLVAQRGAGPAAIYCGACAAGFLAGTFPLWGSFGRFSDAVSLLVRIRAEAGMFVRSEEPGTALRVFFGLPVVAATIAMGARAWFRSRGASTLADNASRRWLAALTLAMAVQTPAFLYQPFPRYLLPALALSGALFVVADKLAPSDRLFRRVAVSLCAVLFAIGAWTVAASWTERSAEISALQERRQGDLHDCSFVAQFHASHPAYALSFAGWYDEYRLAPELSSVFPDFVEYNIFTRAFHRWGAPVDAESHFAGSACIAIAGSAGDTQWSVPGFVESERSGGRLEGLRMLERGTLPAHCEVTLGDGWYGWEADEKGRTVWARADAAVRIASPAEGSITLSAEQLTQVSPNRVDLKWNGAPLNAMDHPDGTWRPLQLQLQLRRGMNRLTLHSREPESRAPGDARLLAVRWANLRVEGSGCTLK